MANSQTKTQIRVEKKTEPSPTDVRGLRLLRRGWKGFASRMGNYQSRELLALFYFLVAAPFGLAV